MLMGWIAFIGLLSGQDVRAARTANPPIVGRPVDFSGAVGGPFVVQWIAVPTELTAEEPLTLTLRVAGPGNLAELRRPALGKLESFRSFAVEDLDDRLLPGDPPRREFRYRVRTRSAAVTEIPRFKFVYFNPRITPPSRGYQTTYADPVPLTVEPRLVAPAEAPGWMLEPPATDDLFGPPRKPWQDWLDWALDKLGMDTESRSDGVTWPIAVIVVLLPPLTCGAWLVVWSRLRPDAVRQAAGRRSRAAAVALRALDRAGGRADSVAAPMLGYLRDRHRLPPTATTPGDIAAALSASGCPLPNVMAVVTLLKRCDAARFGPESNADPTLPVDAAKVILDWEAET
jgi:hypothetical protein